MLDKRSEKDYGGLGLIPLLVFLGLYICSGIVFAILGTDRPFTVMSRYAPMLFGVFVALFFFDRKTSIAHKADIFYANAGRPGPMQLALIVLSAGGFAGAAEAIGGKTSVANLAVSIIPPQFIIPGIFILAAIMATCIGTSIGTLSAILPVAVAMCEGTGLNLGMAAAAVISGAYMGDNLSMISDTTIGATQGVGAQMKDKFRMNVFIVAIPALLTVAALYLASSGTVAHASNMEAGAYNLLTILPYIAVLVLAVIGLDVILVLAIGIVLAGVIGFATGSSFITWINGVSAGMEGMFWLAVYALVISGLVGLVRYYGGLDWMVRKLSHLVKGERSCEYIICLLPFVMSSIIANNTMSIMTTVPICKELGDRYHVAPKRMASLVDIGGCVGVTFIPHANGILMSIAATGCEYGDILPYLYYSLFLAVAVVVVIQFGLLKGKKPAKAAV